MTFERLEALYHGHGPVHYKGELYEIVDLVAHKYYSDKPRVEIEVKKACCIHKQ